MSAAGRGAFRKGNDFYATPEWCVHRLLDRLMENGHPLMRRTIGTSTRALDPCAGDGAIIRACRSWWAMRPERHDWHWHAIEVRPEEESTLRDLCGDHAWCPRDGLGKGWDDLVLTNPPYSLAQEFITGYSMARYSFWFLRINFLGSTARARWWRDQKVNLYVSPDRPPFCLTEEKKKGVPTGRLIPGTDATEYAWFEFGEEAGGRIEVLDQTPRSELSKHRDLLRSAGDQFSLVVGDS